MFASVPLAKADLMAKPRSRGGRIDSTCWWEDLTILTIFQSATLFLVTTEENSCILFRQVPIVGMKVVFDFLSVYKQYC